MLNQKEVLDFINIYKQETGLDISLEQAQEKGSKLIQLIKNVSKELDKKEKNNANK
jgi:hypothetical protein